MGDDATNAAHVSMGNVRAALHKTMRRCVGERDTIHCQIQYVLAVVPCNDVSTVGVRGLRCMAVRPVALRRPRWRA